MKSVAAFSLLCCALATSSAFAVDSLAPEITSLSITPAPVNLTNGGQTMTATMHVVDEEDGFQFGNVTVYNPDGNFVNSMAFTPDDLMAGGTPMSGNYAVAVDLPAHAIPGTWRIEVTLTDTSGHQQIYSNPLDFPSSPNFQVVHNNPEQIDGTVDGEGHWTGSPPVLASFQPVQPAVAPGQQITLRVRITDGLSGFSDGSLSFRNPQGEPESNLWAFFTGFARVNNGDALDGVYEIKVNMPEEAMPGLWHVDFFLADFAGNKAVRNGGDFVVSSGGTTPGSLGNATDSVQYPWNSDTHPWIYQTAVKHDGVDAARSGPTPDNGESVMDTYITGPGTLTFWWRADSEEDKDLLWFEDLTGNQSRVIGGDTGWLQETISLAAGQNHLRWTYAKDATGAAGQDCGWVDQVRFIAEVSDLEAPALQTLEITPDPVDIATGSQWVTFKIHATDDFNGLAGGNLRVLLPDNEEFMSLSFDDSSRLEGGDFRDATYQLMALVPQGSSPGMWRAELDLFEGNSTTVAVYRPGQRAFPNPDEELFLVADGTSLDTTAPQAGEGSATPGVVDISSGTAGTVTVTLRVVDAGTGAVGFGEGDIDVYSVDGDRTGSTRFTAAQRVSGTALNGVYEVQVPVAAFGEPGTWKIGATVKDASGNLTVYHPFDGEDPVTLAQFTVVNNGVVDLLPPTLSSIDITPVAVDVTNSAKNITITVQAGDDVSGLRDAQLFFYRSSGGQPIDSFTQDLLLHPVSGQPGTYQVVVTIPRAADAGEYEVQTFLRDRTGREVRFGIGGQGYPQGTADGRFSVSKSGTGDVSTYQQFTELYGLTGDNALPGADPDGDGYNNSTELLLGTDPGNAASNGNGKLTVARDATHLHLTFTIDPTLDVEAREDEDFLRVGDGTPRFRVSGQVSSTPDSWDDVQPEHVNGQTYRVSVPLSSGPRGFIRLLFTEG